MKMKALYLILLACVVTVASRLNFENAQAGTSGALGLGDDKDAKFVKEAADGGMLEVKLGQYAMMHGTSEHVKTLGQHMFNDHTKANQELTDLAKKKGWSVPSAMSEEKMKIYDDIVKKKGDEFDKEYSDYMVKDHKKVIRMFEEQAKDGKDADLKAWASGKLSTLKHHLEMSEKTCDAIKKGTK